MLPATTFLEREDIPVAFIGFFSTPFMQVTEAVVPPRGEARQEWRIIDDLSRRIGIAPYSLKPLRMLARLGLPHLAAAPDRRGAAHRPGRRLVRPARGPACRSKKVARSPHGIVLGDHIADGVLASRVRHADRRVRVGRCDRAR